MSIVVCHNLLHFALDKVHIPNALHYYNTTSQAISGDFAKVCNYTELKNFTIALSVFMVVDSQI